jgi:hypothetical protein
LTGAVVGKLATSSGNNEVCTHVVEADSLMVYFSFGLTTARSIDRSMLEEENDVLVRAGVSLNYL